MWNGKDRFIVCLHGWVGDYGVNFCLVVYKRIQKVKIFWVLERYKIENWEVGQTRFGEIRGWEARMRVETTSLCWVTCLPAACLPDVFSRLGATASCRRCCGLYHYCFCFKQVECDVVGWWEYGGVCHWFNQSPPQLFNSHSLPSDQSEWLLPTFFLPLPTEIDFTNDAEDSRPSLLDGARV